MASKIRVTSRKLSSNGRNDTVSDLTAMKGDNCGGMGSKPKNKISTVAEKLEDSLVSQPFGPPKFMCMPLPKPKRVLGLCYETLYIATDELFKEGKYSPNPGRVVSLDEFHEATSKDGDEAEIIIVSGEAGAGKTKLFKYFLDSWRSKQDPIRGLDRRDIVFFWELGDCKYNSFTDLTADYVNNMAGMIPRDRVKDFVLLMPVLVMLDDFNDSIGDAYQLVKEVMQMKGVDLKVVITCRPQYVERLYNHIPKHRRDSSIHLELNGIPASYHADFVDQIYDLLPKEHVCEEVRTLLKSCLIRRLPQMRKIFGNEICNPLMFILLTKMWIECPVFD